MLTNHPPKEQVRHYMHQRVKDQTPPPTPADIRTQLGWKLIPGNVSPSSRKR